MKKIKVLLAEHDFKFCQKIREDISCKDIPFLAATYNIATAIEKIKKEDYDVIVTNLIYDENFKIFETIEEKYKYFDGNRPGIIITKTNLTDTELQKCQSYNVDYYIEKPIHPPALKVLIRKANSNKKRRMNKKIKKVV